MSSSHSHHELCRERVSITANLRLQINRCKRENDQQKCLLMIFFYSFFLKICFMCCCGIKNTAISLVALNYIKLNSYE